MKLIPETIDERLTHYWIDYEEDCRPANPSFDHVSKLPHLLCKPEGSHFNSSIFIGADDFYVGSSSILERNELDGIGVNDENKEVYAVFFYDPKIGSVVVDPRSNLEVRRSMRSKKKDANINDMSMPMTATSSPVILEHGDIVKSETLGLEFTYVNEGHVSFWEKGLLERLKSNKSGFEITSYDKKRKFHFEVGIPKPKMPVVEVIEGEEEGQTGLTIENLLGKPIANINIMSYAQIMDKGHCALDSGDREEAISYFLSAAMKRPNRPQAYSKMASLFKASNMFTFYVVSLAAAAANAPDNEELQHELVVSAKRVLGLNPSRYQNILFKTKSHSEYMIVGGDSDIQHGSWGEEVFVPEGKIIGGRSNNTRIESVASIDPDEVGRDRLSDIFSAFTPQQRLKSTRELLESKYQLQDILYEHGKDLALGLVIAATYPNDLLDEFKAPGISTSRVRSISPVGSEQVEDFIGRYSSE